MHGILQQKTGSRDSQSKMDTRETTEKEKRKCDKEKKLLFNAHVLRLTAQPYVGLILP